MCRTAEKSEEGDGEEKARGPCAIADEKKKRQINGVVRRNRTTGPRVRRVRDDDDDIDDGIVVVAPTRTDPIRFLRPGGLEMRRRGKEGD